MPIQNPCGPKLPIDPAAVTAFSIIPQVNSVQDITDYYTQGEHVLVGCDDPNVLSNLAMSIKRANQRRPIAFLKLDENYSQADLIEQTRLSCAELVSEIDQVLASSLVRVDEVLRASMGSFGDLGRQGFLVLMNFDVVTRVQSLSTLEASFRSAMQYGSQIAVLICASNRTIDAMTTQESPFYLSFKVYRL